jgi:hypothetical protein
MYGTRDSHPGRLEGKPIQRGRAQLVHGRAVIKDKPARLGECDMGKATFKMI